MDRQITPYGVFVNTMKKYVAVQGLRMEKAVGGKSMHWWPVFQIMSMPFRASGESNTPAENLDVVNPNIAGCVDEFWDCYKSCN